jgi:hypothetical protein
MIELTSRSWSSSDSNSVQIQWSDHEVSAANTATEKPRKMDIARDLMSVTVKFRFSRLYSGGVWVFSKSSHCPGERANSYAGANRRQCLFRSWKDRCEKQFQHIE